jgi:hypothetical protein
MLFSTGPTKNGSKKSDLACSPTLSAMGGASEEAADAQPKFGSRDNAAAGVLRLTPWKRGLISVACRRQTSMLALVSAGFRDHDYVPKSVRNDFPWCHL